MTKSQSGFISSLKANLKKEWIEGLRTYKFLIIGLSICFFAISDPIMTKLLPEIMKSQFGDVDFSALMDVSQRGVMRSHIENLYQISTLVIGIALMGIVAGEKNERTLTLPIAMGGRPAAVILAKWGIYSAVLAVMTLAGVGFAYLYAGLLMSENFAPAGLVMKAGLLLGLYFSFVMALLIALSTLFKKPFFAGILTLVIAYGLSALGGLFPDTARYLPTQLIAEAQQFSGLPSTELTLSALWTVSAILALLFAACVKLSRDELV